MQLVIDLQGAQGGSHSRGIGRYTRELAMAMARSPRGHDVIVALSGAMPDTGEDLIATFRTILPRNNIRLWHPPVGTAEILDSTQAHFAKTLRVQFLASLKPDLVHVTSIFEGLGDDVTSLQPSELQRLPMVATCYDLIPLIRHNDYFGPQQSLSKSATWYYRRLHEMSMCQGLLAISDSSRNEAIQHLRFSSDRVFNIKAGISADFKPVHLTDGSRRAILQEYGLRDGFILFLGAGDIRKNESGLIAAYARLPRELRLRYQLLIVGKMDPRTLRKTAAQLGIPAARFVIVPFIPESDLNAIYSACALFVFPSLHEGFGLPLAEAMACGAPCIASNTTSLPEVIGRSDATFDPTDPDDIARSMCSVLENTQFRDELAAYGPVQAARFTWQASAELAWDALEQILSLHRAGSTVRTPTLLPRRPRLAFISPFPPQQSGIADYSVELLPQLAFYYDITIVTESHVEEPRLIVAYPCLDPASFRFHASSFDRILYQVGNSSFHRFQIEEMLPRYPGVVVLHDAFLSDYMNWSAHERGKPDEFLGILLMQHGFSALRYEMENGREAAREKYPCSLHVLQCSIGLIQHSNHGAKIIEDHYYRQSGAGITVIPLLRGERARGSRREARRLLDIPEDMFVVASFGHIAWQKCPALIAEAWRESGLSGRLVFVGGGTPEFEHELAGMHTSILVTGRVSDDIYDTWIAASDVAVQLRRGSRGETSAAIGDALAAGLPLVINQHGSAGELPAEITLALPDDADAAALAQALVALHESPARRTSLGAAAARYAHTHLAPTLVARRYFDALESAYSSCEASTVAQAMRGAVHVAANDIAAVSQCLAQSFKSNWCTRGRRLLIDLSIAADRPAGFQQPSRIVALCERGLACPPTGWRAEPVRFVGARLCHTYDVALSVLQLPLLSLPESPIDGCRGDILLIAENKPCMADAAWEELRRLALDGNVIVIIVDNMHSLRDPKLGAKNDPTSAGTRWKKIVQLADVVLCPAHEIAKEFMAWLDLEPSTRAAPVLIGCFDDAFGDIKLADARACTKPVRPPEKLHDIIDHVIDPDLVAVLDSLFDTEWLGLWRPR